MYYAGWSVPNVNGHGFICDGYKTVDSVERKEMPAFPLEKDPCSGDHPPDREYVYEQKDLIRLPHAVSSENCGEHGGAEAGKPYPALSVMRSVTVDKFGDEDYERRRKSEARGGADIGRIVDVGVIVDARVGEREYK